MTLSFPALDSEVAEPVKQTNLRPASRIGMTENCATAVA